MSDSLRLLRRLALPVLISLLVAVSAQAQSSHPRDDEYASPPPNRQNRQSPSRPFADPDRAANAAREATGGRVLGVQQGTDQGGQRGYRVRILEPGGRVRSLHFDPDSGAVRD